MRVRILFWRARKIEVEAVRFSACTARATAFCPGLRLCSDYDSWTWLTPVNSAELETPHGLQTARFGDWIVRDPDGSFRVVKERDFKAKYRALPRPE